MSINKVFTNQKDRFDKFLNLLKTTKQLENGKFYVERKNVLTYYLYHLKNHDITRKVEIKIYKYIDRVDMCFYIENPGLIMIDYYFYKNNIFCDKIIDLNKIRNVITNEQIYKKYIFSKKHLLKTKNLLLEIFE